MPRLIICLLFSIAICPATSPPPYSGQCGVMNRISSFGNEHPASQAAALGLLAQVAEGRVQHPPPELEVQVGLPPGELNRPDYSSYQVRACALRRIGDLHSVEARLYLRSLRPAMFVSDNPGYIWTAAQIALREALLSDLREDEKVSFLENVLTEEHDPLSDSGVSAWAVDRLCNRGSIQSLSVIRTSILRRNTLKDGTAEIGFCEARMQVLASSPDRVNALASALSVQNTVTNPMLTGWAINELFSLNLRRGDAELDRYAKEIEALPESQQDGWLAFRKSDIRRLLQGRRR